MKRRIAMWAGSGFVVAAGWVLYTMVGSPDRVNIALHSAAVQAALMVSCPVVFALRSLPLSFWSVLFINAATYGVAGLVVEVLRRQWNPRVTS